MTVQRQIGFFRDIVKNTQNFSRIHNNNIRPSMPVGDQNLDVAALKAKGSADTTGSSGIFHWNFHKWGDVDNVMGP